MMSLMPEIFVLDARIFSIRLMFKVEVLRISLGAGWLDPSKLYSSLVLRLGVTSRQRFPSATNHPSPSLADRCNAVSQSEELRARNDKTTPPTFTSPFTLARSWRNPSRALQALTTSASAQKERRCSTTTTTFIFLQARPRRGLWSLK
jgi:hypothetical protein